MLVSFLRRFLRFLYRSSWDEERARELEAHLQMEIDENVARGMSPEEARFAAHRKLGNVTLVREEIYRMNSLGWLDDLWSDIRYGSRMMRKNPGFTVVAILTLALGIGGTTTIFSVIECGVRNPFPYTDSRRLVVLAAHDIRHPTVHGTAFVTAPEFLDFQEQNRVFDEVVGVTFGGAFLTGDKPPELFDALGVTSNTFRLLGVPPLIGRTFTPDDCRPGATPVAVLSYKVWRSTFGGDTGIVGRTLVLNHRPTIVVGVMPPRFQWTGGTAFWLPATLARGEPTNQSQRYMFVGHLRPGVSIEQAAADVAVLAKRFATIYPESHPKEKVFGIDSLAEFWIGEEFRRTLYVLLGGVGLLLLISCVNVANLLLARATAREKEIAVRAAIGAGRSRLVCQFVIESLLLAFGGALVGCLFAWAVLGGLKAIIPPELPGEAVIRINGSVLLFTLGATLVSILFFGLMPALHVVGKDLPEPLRASSSRGGNGFRHGKLRNLLVVCEITLSLVLLTGAGLLIRSFFALRHVELGYNPDNMLQAVVFLRGERYKAAGQRTQFHMELLRRVRALPGVTSAALCIRATSNGFDTGIEIEGKPGAGDDRAQYYFSSDSFFESMGIRVSKGRTISEEDFGQARRVAVVNRTFVRDYFGSENPLGRQIEVNGLKAGPFGAVQKPWFEIVGVAADIIVTGDNGPQIPPHPAVYVPYTIGNPRVVQLIMRTAAEPARVINSVRREVASMDKELPVVDVWSGTMRDQLNTDWFTTPRFVLMMMVAFSSLGLTLVCVGVYGVLSYVVSRRAHEIGVRMALGAEPADMRWWVIKAGLRWLAVGIGIGMPASIALARVFQNRIWGIKSADPLTLIVVSAALIVVALAACYVPARQATKVDPMVVLRYE